MTIGLHSQSSRQVRWDDQLRLALAGVSVVHCLSDGVIATGNPERRDKRAMTGEAVLSCQEACRRAHGHDSEGQ
jgi:hypothetical protein